MSEAMHESEFEEILRPHTHRVQALARELRSLILSRDPDCVEVPRPGDRAITFGVGLRKMIDGYAYLMPQRDWVNVGFFRGAQLEDPEGILEGSGKSLRHVKVFSANDLPFPALERLLDRAREERLTAVRKAPSKGPGSRVRSLKTLALLAVSVSSLTACGLFPGSMPVQDAPGQGPHIGITMVDPEPLKEMLQEVSDSDWNVHHVTVASSDSIIFSADFYPYRSRYPHDVASVTKSVVSTLIGIAIEQELIPGVDTPVLSLFPEFDPRTAGLGVEDLRLEDLLTMTSGWCRDFADGEAQLEAMRNTADWVGFMLKQPLVETPGTRFAYCSGASQVLSAAITKASGSNAEEFAQRVLFGPLGISDYRWPADPQGNSTGWGDLFLKPQDLARFGVLFLQNGVWEGNRVVSSDWIRRATSEQVRDGRESYGYRWWIPNSIEGLYEARGRGGQRLVIWPEKKIVVVMLGSGFDPALLGRHIVAAVTGNPTAETSSASYAETWSQLKQLLRQVAGAPLVSTPSTPPLIARSALNANWFLEPNPVGITGFALHRDGPFEATLTLFLDVPRSSEYGPRRTQVGMDGRDRLSPSGRFGLPVAARGSWPDSTTFEVRYDEFAGNHLYWFDFHFRGDTAVVEIRENTGLVSMRLSARRERASSGNE